MDPTYASWRCTLAATQTRRRTALGVPQHRFSTMEDSRSVRFWLNDRTLEWV